MQIQFQKYSLELENLKAQNQKLQGQLEADSGEKEVLRNKLKQQEAIIQNQQK